MYTLSVDDVIWHGQVDIIIIPCIVIISGLTNIRYASSAVVHCEVVNAYSSTVSPMLYQIIHIP